MNAQQQLPKGYRIVWLQGTTACYWVNDQGQTSKTYRWSDDKTYHIACRQDAHRHAAGQCGRTIVWSEFGTVQQATQLPDGQVIDQHRIK